MPSVSSLKTVRSVEVRYESTGADKMRQDADAVAAAQERVGRATTQAAATTAQAAERTATVTETASRRQLSALTAYERERARFDQDYRMRQQLDRSTNLVDRAFNQGFIDAQQRERDLALARNRYAGNDNRPGANGGLSSYDRSFLRYQGFDTALSLSSGMPLQMVAAQQGGQVLQQLADREGGLTAGLKQLGVSAMGLITPFSVAATATAGVAAAFGLAAKQASDDRAMMERATLGLGRGTGATASQLADLATANSEAGKVSTSTARDIVTAYASTGRIALPVIGDLTRVTGDFARLVGTDVPTAAADLARAFADPARGAEELAGRIGGLDDRTLQLIRTQQDANDRAGAQRTTFEYLRGVVEQNTAATSAWGSAWNYVSSAADAAWQSMKRAAGVTLGTVPETTQEQLAKLRGQRRNPLDIINDPQGYEDGDRQLKIDALEARKRREEEAARRQADLDRAERLSREAGDVSRGIDPNGARLQELTRQRATLSGALSDPTYWEKMSGEDFSRLSSSYDAVSRARETLTDVNGRLITSEERIRRQNQLALDMANAKTDAERASVAARQKELELAGQSVTRGDAASQIDYARRLSLASASSKGGGDDRDDFDRAIRSTEDRIRRQQEEAETYGMGAAAVAHYRTETELLTAAKRAERDVTPALVEQVRGYAEQAAAAADKQDQLREAMRQMDDVRGAGRSVFSGLFTDMSNGARGADILTHALTTVERKLIDIASQSLTDDIFGKTGTSGTGALGGLLGAAKSLFGFADGGMVYGPGGPRDDRVLARLSPGEYVVNAAATSRHLDLLHTINRGTPRYADGGMVALPRLPAGPSPSAGAGPIAVNLIDQRPAGSPDVEVRAQQRPGGGVDLVMRQLDKRIRTQAQKAANPAAYLQG